MVRHKIISAVVVVTLAGAGYYWYSSASSKGKVSYVESPVEKGTMVLSVSGSGQVSASNQMDIKSKVSENVVYVGVKNGQQVKAGKLLMQFDTANAEKLVRNATLSLDNAKLSFQKLAGNFGAAVPLNKQQAQDNLAQAYNNGFNTVANAFLDLPGIITGLDAVLFGNDLSKSSQNIDYYRDYTRPYNEKADQYRSDAYDSYQKAKASYDANFNDYKLISRYSNTNALDLIIDETYKTTQDISDAIKNANNFIQFYKDIFTNEKFAINPVADVQLASLNNYTGKANADLSNLLSIQSAIKNNKTALSNSDLDLESQNLSVKQAENALLDAKERLADCYIYAPFDGTVANLNYKKGDSAASGTVAVTFITDKSITKIPFNEVDIIKIKEGQKATLTFDAIDGLTIAGQVGQIDTLGTVSQGVVNYNVEVVFDAKDTQVKPGMSVTANIITDVKQNIILVPNSAVKTSGNQKYAQVLANGKPEQRNIETGLSNDNDTEVMSGLQEGEHVITQTITAGSAGAQSNLQSSSLRIPGITGGGGGGSGFGGGNRNSTGR